MKFNFFRDEKGTGLLEILVALPLISVLLATFAIMLCFGIRSYVFTRSNIELQEQVRIPLERIVRDLNNAEDVKISGNSLAIKCRYSNELLWVSYYLTGSNNVNSKMMRSWKNNSQPLTGESKLGDIQFTRFFYKITGKTVYIEISAINCLTKKEYELHTAVTLPVKGGV